MADIDEKKPTGKAGKRKRNADQRNRKSDQKQAPKPDQPRSAKAQVEALMVTSTGVGPIEPIASKARADTTIMMAAAAPVAAQDIPKPSAVLMTPAKAAPVAEQQPAPTVLTADALPVVARVISEPSAVEMQSVDMTPSNLAPSDVTPSAAEVEESAVASIPTEIEAFPVPATDLAVSLQTLANAYGDYTRKSLEQTKWFFDKLTGVRSLDQAVEIQTEFAKQACETFVAEARKIGELHRELARQRFERLEGFMSIGPQTAGWV